MVKQMEGKRKKPHRNLNTDAEGNLLTCAREVADTWYAFLKKKFQTTDAENERPDMPVLPEAPEDSDLTDREILTGLSKMPNNKACGIDGIPVEVFKYSPLCKQLLIVLIKQIWRTEEIPEQFAKAVFVMLYKNKGSSNNPAKYRCIGLLCHAYKVLSQCMLARLNLETKGFLADWQAGFRAERDCRDKILILRTLVDDILAQGKEICEISIDYSYTVAFDSVIHKHIDRALGEAGASVKTRRMFRAIY